MTVIPADPKEAGAAKQQFQQALGESNTTVLLFKSGIANEAVVGGIVTLAEQLAQRENPAEWRVIWVKDASLVPDEIKYYFGADGDKIAAALKFGTGVPRTVAGLFALGELGDRVAIGQAFANAGPEDA